MGNQHYKLKTTSLVSFRSIIVMSTCFHLRSVQEGVVLKKEIQTGLGWLRGCSPLQLNLTQLVTLARHFKERVSYL